MPRKSKPRLVPLEHVSEPRVIPGVIRPGPPTLHLLRRVLQPFEVAPPPQEGNNYWFVQLLNEHTALEYAGMYVVLVPEKEPKAGWWQPRELAVACADRLNEYRGLVGLQEHRDGVCVFQALFASNSLWTFCVWSTDAARCPPAKAKPDGWQPGDGFPEGLPRKPGPGYPPDGCDHPDRDGAKFSKLAQRQFA